MSILGYITHIVIPKYSPIIELFLYIIIVLLFPPYTCYESETRMLSVLNVKIQVVDIRTGAWEVKWNFSDWSGWQRLSFCPPQHKKWMCSFYYFTLSLQLYFAEIHVIEFFFHNLLGHKCSYYVRSIVSDNAVRQFFRPSCCSTGVCPLLCHCLILLLNTVQAAFGFCKVLCVEETP